MLHAVSVHHEHNDVGFFAADEKTKITAGDAERTGCAPADTAGFTASEEAFAVLAAHDETAGFEVRNDDDAGCFIQQILRNALVRSIHHLVQVFGRCLKTRVGVFLRERWNSKKRRQQGSCEYPHISSSTSVKYF